MANEILELQKQHQAGQEKYTYFLLAAAGTCIAYSMETSLGTPISLHLLLLVVAVLSWSLSFYFGCRCANKVQALLRANAGLLSLHEGTHENQPQHAELLAAAIRGIRDAISQNIKSAGKFSGMQFRLFVLGGISFVLWRTFEIIRLAPS